MDLISYSLQCNLVSCFLKMESKNLHHIISKTIHLHHLFISYIIINLIVKYQFSNIKICLINKLTLETIMYNISFKAS